jgi:hypothetical protein
MRGVSRARLASASPISGSSGTASTGCGSSTSGTAKRAGGVSLPARSRMSALELSGAQSAIWTWSSGRLQGGRRKLASIACGPAAERRKTPIIAEICGDWCHGFQVIRSAVSPAVYAYPPTLSHKPSLGEGSLQVTWMLPDDSRPGQGRSRYAQHVANDPPKCPPRFFLASTRNALPEIASKQERRNSYEAYGDWSCRRPGSTGSNRWVLPGFRGAGGRQHHHSCDHGCRHSAGWACAAGPADAAGWACAACAADTAGWTCAAGPADAAWLA